MDDIERLRRWIEDPPELATPQDVLSMLASLTSLTDELQRLRGERDAVLEAFYCDGCGHGFDWSAHVYGFRSCCPDCSHGPFIAFLGQALASHTGDTSAVNP